ncbi:MAG TPA: 5-(carboxyamino)imidazole ribonucleotide synthase [Sulfurovum sp.]|nr:5-(carboxyamino)imidazole ribonucleotide synthase [Sulfurovum sp.]HQS72302.1 5-(carboxyamino)imidazole ribonucleotide synthase [Sulfurovum sp.]HQS77033.1 5-(carboxyamino)imidazole ribonucleotide synthase [Sulfurovum sp.]HQT28507.1 5-(carboxyamino)imidazole ribonucleotide synthase [Sulfurovum sp.]
MQSKTLIEKLSTSSLKMGIIAGGQLGKMLIQEASRWDIVTYVLDPDEACSARNVASFYVKGDFRDFDAVYAFGKQVDILTFELEDVNIPALQKLKAEGLNIAPDPDVLALIQDKGLQKAFYAKHHLPSSDFALYESSDAIKEAITKGVLDYPFVQKLRKGGYDGRGVALINGSDKVLLEGASVVETKVAIDKEIAVIVARNSADEVRCFPAVEMTFDEQTNLVEEIFCPANLTTEQATKAQSLAIEIIRALDMVGLLAVEFFIDKEGQILINEVAPRPHNSGHHTIDSMLTSQHKQLLRAILGLPLGTTEVLKKSVMLNLLGEVGHEGAVYYEGFEACMAIEGVKIHLYGKKETRPSRKMGHVTILSDSLEHAQHKANIVKNTLKVKSWKK